MPDRLERTPPKSESLRRTYGSEIPTGDRPHGAEATDPIVIASFHCPETSGDFQRALSIAGISSTKESQGKKTRVSVDYEDLDHAVDILANHQKQHPDSPPPAIRRDYDFLIFGAIIGGGVGLALLFASSNRLSFALITASLTFSGALIGHFIDTLTWSRRTFGLRFGLLEALLLMVACALLLSLPRLWPAS